MVRHMDYTGLSAEQIAQTMTEKQLTYVQHKIAGHTVQECVVLAGYKLHKGQENAWHHGDYMNLKMKAYEKAVMEKVAKEVEDGIEGTLTYCDFPGEHGIRIRTNNVIEQLNWEI